MGSRKFGIVFVGVGIFPYRICGDKNFLLDLADELRTMHVETRFVSIVNGPQDLPHCDNFIFLDRVLHSPTEKYVRREGQKIVAYRHDHGLLRTWLEIGATLLSNRRTFERVFQDFENVIVHWMDSSLMLPVLRAACGSKPAYVSTVFRYRSASGIGRQLRSRALRSADRIITGTHAARDLLVADGCPPGTAVVAPWGCRQIDVQNVHRKRSQLRILWSGFLQQIGKQDFLDTVRLVRRVRRVRTDIDFVFSLKPECYSKEFADFRAPGIDVRAGSPAFITELSEYDAFLSPVGDRCSSSAPPLTWVEAMAAGVPIITTEHPGVEEVLDHGSCGILARDYTHLEQLLLDPQLGSALARMREPARRRQRDHYDATKIGATYMEIYDQLLTSRR